MSSVYECRLSLNVYECQGMFMISHECQWTNEPMNQWTTEFVNTWIILMHHYQKSNQVKIWKGNPTWKPQTAFRALHKWTDELTNLRVKESTKQQINEWMTENVCINTCFIAVSSRADPRTILTIHINASILNTLHIGYKQNYEKVRKV